MAKSLTQNEIKLMAKKWAKAQMRLTQYAADREQELEPVKIALAKKIKPITDKYDALIDPLQETADGLEMQINEWLAKQKKSIRIETKNAIAEFVKGTKLGNRIVDAEKFVAKCVERKIKDFWSLVSVTIKSAESVMGKDDMAEICKQEKQSSEIVSLELKD